MSVKSDNAETEKAMRGRAAEKLLARRRPTCAICYHMALNHPLGRCKFLGCECPSYEAQP